MIVIIEGTNILMMSRLYCIYYESFPPLFEQPLAPPLEPNLYQYKLKYNYINQRDIVLLSL